ncbi:hypothetical protein M2152_001092 [Microbacteriaceae bacterium SG_E_30_P1]|uniref:Acetone carboxylase n=1 Tax=Antiquaquibacter oligotrophicus TaxID=2880260 RepID=A0ABT6KME2_9MICO|nr:hypothetical protein [Antiquaquibacter oligotrophicus]MDH6180910.1 hypothetical protein [Antiquaquibacter oligotrophicus]UDF13385.1 hypothetical protein LH407_00525 [Antiquaquibacter oligotrophicus]
MTLFDSSAPGDAIPSTCSRAACRASATWTVAWRNPRIHSPERKKLWLACDEHRDFLETYLSSRGFPVVVVPAGSEVPQLPQAGTA